MEANKILSADILDLVFEGRNKDYGAYDLRKTYNRRITRALIITASLAALALGGSILFSAMKKKDDNKLKLNEMTIQDLKQDEVKEPPPSILAIILNFVFISVILCSYISTRNIQECSEARVYSTRDQDVKSAGHVNDMLFSIKGFILFE